ncbi:MAG: type II toxin-antitoxin system PemK/MazF family toxin [Deltaproteobacteria bacterium]|nr:type II toxin-antitoxin system PemK/MazF family toxin [Deltaproteobacteria bacterium]
MRLDRGTVILLDLDPTVRHEQRGVRPCIVVSDPDVVADQRFPLVCVVPLTGTPGEGALYPSLSPGQSGLTKASYALIDHLRSADKRRVRRVFGQLGRHELDAIDEGLALFLGLGDKLASAPPPGGQ